HAAPVLVPEVADSYRPVLRLMQPARDGYQVGRRRRRQTIRKAQTAGLGVLALVFVLGRRGDRLAGTVLVHRAHETAGVLAVRWGVRGSGGSAAERSALRLVDRPLGCVRDLCLGAVLCERRSVGSRRGTHLVDPRA